jgi:hypothetical protein
MQVQAANADEGAAMEMVLLAGDLVGYFGYITVRGIMSLGELMLCICICPVVFL